MIPVVAFWLPIAASAVLVWIASMMIWMLMPYHRSDYRGFPDEDAVRTALKGQELKPGQYNIPNVASRKELDAPEGKRKFEEGPVGFFTLLPNRVPPVGRQMVIIFVYYLLVGATVAYVASRTLGGDTPGYLVFQVTGTVTWMAYGLAGVPDAVWFGRPWRAVAKQLLDAFLLGLVTGGVFVWLWPR